MIFADWKSVASLFAGHLVLSFLLVSPIQAQQFGAHKVITTSADGARSVHAADLDGDGDKDVLSASRGDDKVAWYENTGGSFTDQQVITTSAENANSVYAVDLDEDGDKDVLSSSLHDDKIAWYENTGGSFTDQQVITTNADGAKSVYAADLDGDGDKDVLSASAYDDKIAWYENTGGSFSDQQVITAIADGAEAVYAADLDGDGDKDVLSAPANDDMVAWHENSGGSFSDQQVITTSADGTKSVYAADLDGDGDKDVLSASTHDEKIAWYENTGGSFSDQQVIAPGAQGAQSVYAADLDGDEDKDVLSASTHDQKIAWYENTGGSFSDQQVITTSADGSTVYAADLDGDGDKDVLSDWSGDKIVWYENQSSGGGQSEGLIAHYPFDGNANDASGNGNDGTLNGDPEFTNGVTGQAISFDGDGDFVQTGSSSSLQVDESLSISAWVYYESSPSRMTISVQGTNFDTDGNWQFYLLSDGKVTLGQNNTPGCCGAESNGSIAPQSWNHIAVSFSSGTTKFYFNGELDSVKEVDNSSFNTTSDGIKIGDREYTGDETDDFDGRMDAFRLYNRALIESEVQEIFESTIPTGLSASAEDGSVSLSWNAPTEGDLDGYNVYRSTLPFTEVTDAKTKVNSSLIESTSYTDESVDDGTTYYYRVTAVSNDGNESPPSGQASAALQKLQLLGLEVNQSVQTWENDVMPLVEGKKTIVRAHLQNEGTGSTPVNVKLRGTRDGSPLSGSPETAENADTYEAPSPPGPSKSNEAFIRQQRAKWSGSLNFSLPPDWREGTVTLSLMGDNINCDETPAVNSDCEIEVTFEPTGTPKIKVFSIGWEDGSGTVHLPEYNINAIRDRLEAMYPVQNINIVVGGDSFIIPCDNSTCDPPKSEDIIGKLNGGLLSDFLSTSFKVDFTDDREMYIGLVSEAQDYEGKSNDIGGQFAYSMTNIEDVPSVVAHELAHLHGLRHATNEVNGTNNKGQVLGWCGGVGARDPAFPATYVTDDIDIPKDNDGEEIWNGFTGISPVQNASSEEQVWGVDTEQKKVIGTTKYGSPDEDSDLSGANGELMSYCSDITFDDSNIGALWTSDLTYTALQERISSFSKILATEEPELSSDEVASTAQMTSQLEDYLLVRGKVNLQSDNLEFRPITTVSTTPDRVDTVAPDSGEYTLQALDESGSVVEEVSFEPNVGISKTISEVGIFAIPIQADPTIEEVQVLNGGEENSLSDKSNAVEQANGNVLGSKTASPNPPTATVQYPDGGEDLSGDEVTLQWTGHDPDGDPLSYTVKYSRNGGSTWKTLETDWPRDSLTVDASALGGTSSGLIQVQASDGFNTAQDESDGTFGSSNVSPSASIFSPSDDAVVGQTGSIALDGGGSDPEDGSLSGSALKWRTASGDSLGAGETVDVSAANFSLGTHTIELVATDSVGASDTASVSIQVALSNDPSLLASASALVESDSLFSFGGTGTNIDFAGTSGAATVTAELYDSAPIGADGIPQSNVSKYRILIAAGNGLSVGPGTEVRFEADTLGGIGDPTQVQIYRRPAPGNGPFEALETQVDSMDTPDDPSDDVIFATVSGLGEFVLASDSEPLPVELSSFDATVDGESAVRLTWTTASETGNAGFRVQRKNGEKQAETWTTVGSVEGTGTTTEPERYRYVDEGLPYEADRLTYRLKQVDTDGTASYSKEVTVEREVKEAELLGTYPNPAQTQATLRYAVPERQDVKIHLYDILGRRVQTVVDGEREGRHKQQLDVSRLASGVYFLRLRAEGATKTQKLTVVR